MPARLVLALLCWCLCETQKDRTVIHEFIRHVILELLGDDTIEDVLRLLRKLPWNSDPSVEGTRDALCVDVLLCSCSWSKCLLAWLVVVVCSNHVCDTARSHTPSCWIAASRCVQVSC